MVSKADHQWSHTSKLSTTHEETFKFGSNLRGGSGLHLPHSHSTADPQVSKVSAASLTKKEGVRSGAKHSHSWLQRRFKTHRHVSQKQGQVQKVGVCRGSKLRWWVKIKKKCNKAFGANSKWDRERQGGKCGEAWNDCNTGFYAVCCTQPLGPKNMDAYCAKQNLTFVTAGGANANQSEDKACQVSNQMKGVKDTMRSIKDTISLMDQDAIVSHFGGPSPGPAPMPAPAPAPAVIMPPPGLMPTVVVAAAPAATVFGPPLPSPLDRRCAMLTELTRQAGERIRAIKSWAERGGFEKPEKHKHKHLGHPYDRSGDRSNERPDDKEEDQESADPDLFFTVKGILQVGKKLEHMMKDANFCNRGPEEDDDDDDDEDVGKDLEKDPTEDWDDDDEEDEETVTKINETAILDLLNWEGDMNNAVKKFDQEVHPHGFKWWRYRYQYTIVESMVLAFSVIVLYLTMWVLHGVSFFEKFRFYKTGIPQRLDRYAWGYFVFHAASLMVMVTTAYMLYIPWGKQNVFDIFAEVFHNLVDEQFNVPFLGYSWLYMVLDVQFQLFGCFTLYSLFLVMISKSFRKALEDFKAIGDERDDLSVDPRNQHLYTILEGIIKKRVQNTPEFINVFVGMKLSMQGVDVLDRTGPGWNEFKLHLYLTDGLGKTLEYLCEVSLTTNIFLACSALLVALLAHHFQVAFMFFLPLFVVIGLIMFAASYFVSKYFRALSDNDDHNTPTVWVTVHSYCRAIQIMLYCLFFSFSRLLLSNDIFELYPMVYLSALIGLAAVIGLLVVFAGRMIKEAVCALILPPHLEQDRFRSNLQQIVMWHATQYCHECGQQQFPVHASPSREWAGKSVAGRQVGGWEEEPKTARAFGGAFSWRG